VWVLGVAQYDGPGTYELDALQTLSVEIVESPDADARQFTTSDAATATLEVDGANNGSFEFAGLTSPDGAELSGSFTWTCENGT
jgi:hypothetical protein